MIGRATSLHVMLWQRRHWAFTVCYRALNSKSNSLLCLLQLLFVGASWLYRHRYVKSDARLDASRHVTHFLATRQASIVIRGDRYVRPGADACRVGCRCSEQAAIGGLHAGRQGIFCVQRLYGNTSTSELGRKSRKPAYSTWRFYR